MIGTNTYNPQGQELMELDAFREMDAAAVSQGLLIELMMEQAGHHLARIALEYCPGARHIHVCTGPGNNGGGGLVAARRLAARGIKTSFDRMDPNISLLVNRQLKRAVAMGAEESFPESADLYLDAYLGFSQRLPLGIQLSKRIAAIHARKKPIISLDLPTGIGGQDGFRPDAILCLAAPKKVLMEYIGKVPVYVADLGIPFTIYKNFGFTSPVPFDAGGICEWK